MTEATLPIVDDARAKRSVFILIWAQSILGAQMPVHFILGGLAGKMLAPDPSLATLPISMTVLVTMFAAPVMSMIMGTGIGGGVAYDGRLRPGPTQLGGEFGHVSASAAIVKKHDLPIYQCGCGRFGCVETYIAGPGLERLAKDLTGRTMTTMEIGQTKDEAGDAQNVWSVWLELTIDLFQSLVQSIDPNIIVIGGGLSKIPEVEKDLSDRFAQSQLTGFGAPNVVLASGGDASGARGAALAAAQENGHV